MNENAKTLTFVVLAALAVLLAVWVVRPSLHIAAPEDLRGELLYPKFTDPLAVKSLEIVKFDEQRGEVCPFKVAQVDVKGKKRWSIPSHEDYPADAKDQVASAAAGLMGLKVIDMVSSDQGDQRVYGVIDPNPKNLKMGDTGVGQKVIMRDENGKPLLALIIGKQVPDRPGLYYVRKEDESPIYIVEAKTDKLSTEFDKWIERNLLQINSFDISRLWIRDYSVDELNAALVQRGEFLIEYNDTANPKWKLIEDKKFVKDSNSPTGGKWEVVKMAEDEELNAAKLDTLKTALDDLKIVDVSRKPAGLSADLKAAADFAQKEDARLSLAEKGFFPAQLEKDGPLELFSNEGEIRVIMKDGVEYVLRFGEIAGGAAKKDAKESAEEKTEDQPGGSGLNRYLFVMAEFNPDIIPKPELAPLPELKKSDEAKPAEEAKKTDEAKPEEKTEAEKKPDEGKTDDEKKLDAEREQIEKENKRKQEEYDQKIADGKKRVEELNARFADWYYIISDEVYRKIHLSQDEIIQKKPKPEEKKDEHAGHDHEPANGEPPLNP